MGIVFRAMAARSLSEGYKSESIEMLAYFASNKKALYLRRHGSKYTLHKEISYMQLQLTRSSQDNNPPKETIPYSNEAMRQDLDRLRGVWDDCQASRNRNAIYAYLTAVYGLVAWWRAEGRDLDRARRALRLRRLDVSEREDPFAAIIRCTADQAKADKRTRSKWSRVMRYAATYKHDSEPLDAFIRRKGGINACAARFSRSLRLKKAKHVQSPPSKRPGVSRRQSVVG
jgi:hypothetical protein